MQGSIKKLPHVLIGTPVKNSKPYLEGYAHQVVRLDYPKENITIAIVENDSEDKSWEFLNQKIVPFFKKFPYKAVHLEKRDLNFKLSHHSRHLKQFSTKRQQSIDRSRQYIIDTYLVGNEYVLWFDSDFELVPPHSLKTALSYNADVLVHYLRLKDGTLYDASTFSEGRFIGKLLKEDRQKESWPVESTNCHYLIHHRVFDRGYKYWNTDIPNPEQSPVNIRRSKSPHSIYFFKGKNINAIFTTKVTTLHKMIGGTQPVKRR